MSSTLPLYIQWWSRMCTVFKIVILQRVYNFVAFLATVHLSLPSSIALKMVVKTKLRYGLAAANVLIVSKEIRRLIFHLTNYGWTNISNCNDDYKGSISLNGFRDQSCGKIRLYKWCFRPNFYEIDPKKVNKIL